MKIAASIALSILLVAGVPAHAQDPNPQDRVEIDTNLFCETQQQVERFLTHFKGNGQNAEAAIAAVNGENQMVNACVIATAAYRSGARVSTVGEDDITFDVVRIVVVGVYTVKGLERSLPTELFTLIPREEDSSTVGRGP